VRASYITKAKIEEKSRNRNRVRETRGDRLAEHTTTRHQTPPSHPPMYALSPLLSYLILCTAVRDNSPMQVHALNSRHTMPSDDGGSPVCGEPAPTPAQEPADTAGEVVSPEQRKVRRRRKRKEAAASEAESRLSFADELGDEEEEEAAAASPRASLGALTAGRFEAEAKASRKRSSSSSSSPC